MGKVIVEVGARPLHDIPEHHRGGAALGSTRYHDEYQGREDSK